MAFDRQKFLAELVAFRALVDVALMELTTAVEPKEPNKGKGFLLTDEQKKNCKHKLLPGMGRYAVCQVCGETVERGDVDE